MVGKNVCWCCWVYHLKHFGLESSDWRIPFVQCKDAKNDSIPDRNVSGPMNKSWIVKIDFISSSTHGTWFSYLNISVAVMSACFFIYVGTERSHTHIFCLFFLPFTALQRPDVTAIYLLGHGSAIVSNHMWSSAIGSIETFVRLTQGKAVENFHLSNQV